LKRIAEATLYSFLVALGLAGAWLLRGQFHLGSSTNLSSQSADGQLTTSSNDVRIKPPQEVGWTNAYGVAAVNYGDQIFVGADSKAQLRVTDFSLDISSGSLLTVSKVSNSSGIDIVEGRASLTLNDGKAVGVSLGQETVSLSGAQGSKLELSRKNEAGSQVLGVSLTEGATSIKFPTGESVSGEAGQSFVAKKAEGQSLQLARFELKSIAPKTNSAFLAKQPLSFQWKSSGDELTDLKLLIARDREFTKIVESQPATGSSVEMKAPREPGVYFWTLTGTSNGLQIYGEKRSFSVIELRAINIIDPLFEFKTAGIWNVKAVLEEVELATRYRLQASTDPSFEKPFIDETSTTNIASLVFENRQGRIYVRARVEYSTIKEPAPWSETVTFEIPEPPGVPTLNFTIAQTSDLDVSWSPTKNTDSYMVQTSETPDFKSPQESPVTEAKISLACLKNRFRYVRANGRQNSGVYGQWSEPVLLPGCVAPLKIGTVVLTPPYLPRFKKKTQPELQFKWAGDTLGKDITIEISQDPGFKQPLRFTTRSQMVVRDLKTRGRHFIRAIQNLESKKFVFGYSQPAKVEETEFPKLNVPDLTQPPPRETFLMRADAKVPVILKWSEVPDKVGFDIQVARDKEFTNLVLEKSTARTAVRLAETISTPGSYYWRIRSYHQFASSAWSEARVFTVTYAK
jgi:hypothetical protein